MKIQRKGIRGRVTALAVVALSVAGLAVTPLGSAFAAGSPGDPNDSDGPEGPDRGGPVIYLSRHGAPTKCSFKVQMTVSYLVGPSQEETSLHRDSCDGTLWLPPQVTTLRIYGADSLTDEFSAITQTLDVSFPEVGNNMAYCVLAKADGVLEYTNSSEKGGACNGE